MTPCEGRTGSLSLVSSAPRHFRLSLRSRERITHKAWTFARHLCHPLRSLQRTPSLLLPPALSNALILIYIYAWSFPGAWETAPGGTRTRPHRLMSFSVCRVPQSVPAYLSQGPPVLLHPERVVPLSESERFERTFQPNVALAPVSQHRPKVECTDAQVSSFRIRLRTLHNPPPPPNNSYHPSLSINCIECTRRIRRVGRGWACMHRARA